MLKSKSANFMTGFILGLAAGSAIGLLLAPARGKEVRQRLGNQAPQLGNRAGAAAQRALVQSKGLAAQGLAKLGATAGEARARLVRESLRRPSDQTALSTDSQSDEQDGGG